MTTEYIIGDCLEEMNKLPDGSIDLIFSDLPNNIGIDYGVYKDNLPSDEYEAWLSEVFAQCRRVLKPHAILVLVATKRSISVYQSILAGTMSQIDVLRWDKGTVDRTPNRDLSEYVLVFSEDASTPTNEVLTIMPIYTTKNPLYETVGRKHPAAFPVELAKEVVMRYTKDNDLVLDMCAGLGTVGKACEELGRRSICIELDDRYREK